MKDNKEYYYFKIKKHKDALPSLRREFEYSLLDNYDEMRKRINAAILDKIKRDNLNDKHPVYILIHPEIKEIYIYNKEQWDLYYKYNLINECIKNKSIKLEFSLEDNIDNILKNRKIKKNKSLIMNYIIKNVPVNICLNTIIKFFKSREDMAKEFVKFFISEIINEISKEFKVDNINDNLNINSLIGDEDIKNKKINDNFYKDYFVHKSDFFEELEHNFKEICQNLKSYEEIKKIIKEDEEKDKKSGDEDPNKHINNTSLDLVKGESLERLSLFKNNNINDNLNDNNVLFTAFTPPDYVKKLMDNQKLLIINKDEYYSGIEDFKDLINRDTLENSLKRDMNN